MRSQPFRDDSFQPQLAGVPEDDVSDLVDVLVPPQPSLGLAQEAPERQLALFDRGTPQISAVELDRSEPMIAWG
jgi:hypothetical protein